MCKHEYVFKKTLKSQKCHKIQVKRGVNCVISTQKPVKHQVGE